jgi:large subunit ribosomal protein L21
MYAIVSIAGQQFKVAKDQQIFVHRLQGDEGASIEFDSVLLAENEGKFKLGSDLKGAKVSAKILSHLKGDKVIVSSKRKEEKVTKRKTVTVSNLPRSRSPVLHYN